MHDLLEPVWAWAATSRLLHRLLRSCGGCAPPAAEMWFVTRPSHTPFAVTSPQLELWLQQAGEELCFPAISAPLVPGLSFHSQGGDWFVGADPASAFSVSGWVGCADPKFASPTLASSGSVGRRPSFRKSVCFTGPVPELWPPIWSWRSGGGRQLFTPPGLPQAHRVQQRVVSPRSPIPLWLPPGVPTSEYTVLKYEIYPTTPNLTEPNTTRFYMILKSVVCLQDAHTRSHTLDTVPLLTCFARDLSFACAYTSCVLTISPLRYRTCATEGL